MLPELKATLQQLLTLPGREGCLRALLRQRLPEEVEGRTVSC